MFIVISEGAITIRYLDEGYNFRTYRYAAPGTRVATITACVTDEENRCTEDPITYQLNQNIQNDFRMRTQLTGVIDTAKTISESVDHIFQFSVLASGAGVISLQPITVTVSSRNMYHPQLDSQTTTCYAYVQLPANQQICQLRATDQDLVDYNSIIYYRIIGGVQDYKYFYIDRRSGIIKTSNEPLISGKPLTLMVEAYNHNASPYKGNTTTVKIVISDISGRSMIRLLYFNDIKYNFVCM